MGGSPPCLADLRDQVDGVFCWCIRCSHNAVVPLDVLIARLGPSLPFPAVHGRLRCQACGSTEIEARPDWRGLGQVTRHLPPIPQIESVDPIDVEAG
jgi:hypothetical protein